jgi:hypothetical protein
MSVSFPQLPRLKKLSHPGFIFPSTTLHIQPIIKSCSLHLWNVPRSSHPLPSTTTVLNLSKCHPNTIITPFLPSPQLELSLWLSHPTWTCPRNQLRASGDTEKDNRQKTKHTQSRSQVGCVILGNRRNLWPLLSEHKHLRKKQLYWILSTFAAEALPTQACSLLGITVLAPFCGLGLCQTQARSLFDTAVLMYSALHTRLLSF